MSWRDYPEEEESVVVRDRGTFLERMVGWLLSYPVRTMIAMLIILMILTFVCGL